MDNLDRVILGAFIKVGNLASTRDIAIACGQALYQFERRLIALELDGYITGGTVNWQAVWSLTADGMVELDRERQGRAPAGRRDL